MTSFDITLERPEVLGHRHAMPCILASDVFVGSVPKMELGGGKVQNPRQKYSFLSSRAETLQDVSTSI